MPLRPKPYTRHQQCVDTQKPYSVCCIIEMAKGDFPLAKNTLQLYKLQRSLVKKIQPNL